MCSQSVSSSRETIINLVLDRTTEIQGELLLKRFGDTVK